MNVEPRTLCVDIDGTIAAARADLNYSLCDPIPGAVEALRALRAQGWFIMLHTARHINRLPDTVDWLKRHGFEYDHLVMGKPTGRYYIDDRAIEFKGEWGPVVERLGTPPAVA